MNNLFNWLLISEFRADQRRTLRYLKVFWTAYCHVGSIVGYFQVCLTIMECKGIFLDLTRLHLAFSNFFLRVLTPHMTHTHPKSTFLRVSEYIWVWRW